MAKRSGRQLALAFGPLAALLLLGAGCADATACPATDSRGVVTSNGGNDLGVRLDGGEAVVLHIANASVMRAAGGACSPANVAGILVGSAIAFQAGAWAESSPRQAWPAVVILL